MERCLWKRGYDRDKELAQSKCRDVAIDYNCSWWSRRRVFGVEVICKGCDKGALRPESVQANGEALGQFENPLREGAGVQRVEEGDGGGMRIGMGRDC